MKALGVLGLAILTLAPSQPARAPLDVVVMIDVSYSVTHPGFFKTDRELLPDAAVALGKLLEPTDRLRLGVFGTTVAITPAVLTDAAAIAQAAAGFAEVIGGPSPVWDALDASATALASATGRRGLVVVTDGRSTANRIGFADVVERLERDHLPVFVVALDLKNLSGPDPAIRLRQLADRTGGEYIEVKRQGIGAGLRRAFASLRIR